MVGNMLIIGSVAAIHAGIPIVRNGDIKDIDYIVTQDEMDSFGVPWKHIEDNKYFYKIAEDGSDSEGVIEIEVASPGSSSEMLLEIYSGLEFAPPEALYVLKMSHRYRKNSPHFYKTMRDIMVMRSEVFCGRTLVGDIAPELMEFYDLRREETYGPQAHKTEAQRLARTKEEFFTTEGVEYLYDHDTIHQAVAVGDTPIFFDYLADVGDTTAEVAWDPAKFFAMPYETQLAAVYEEASVLALERSVVPLDVDPNKAFDIAMQKFVANISHGEFRDFAYDHFFEVYELRKTKGWDFHKDFLDGLNSGVVQYA